MKFSYTMKTRVNPSKIMRVWKDVPNWKKWDYQLEYSKMNGTFKQGATGILKSKRGPESKFMIEYAGEDKLIFSIDFPLTKLRITRTVRPFEKGCNFTHETSFEGPFGFFYGIVFGSRFKKELPIVMGKVKKLAEE